MDASKSEYPYDDIASLFSAAPRRSVPFHRA